MHRGPTVDPGPLWNSKSGSKQLQPLSTSTYQKAKTLLRNSQRYQLRKATGDYNPSTDPINRLARHEQTTIFGLGTGHCSLLAHQKRTGIMDSAIAKKRSRRSTTCSWTVSSGGKRDTSYGRRMSQPTTSCGEGRKTCTSPPNSWQHVD